jgi:hypothetical protein
MNPGQKSRTRAVVVEVDPALARRSPPPQIEQSPLYGVAMLKIAMELKKPGARELDEILTGVLARMKLPEDEFRQYLTQNGGLLRTIAERKKY